MARVTELLGAYWPVAAIAAVLLLALLTFMRTMRRPAAAAPAAVATPRPAPTPAQRLAASIEEAARQKAQAAKTASSAHLPLVVPPRPRESVWSARPEPVTKPAEPPVALPPAPVSEEIARLPPTRPVVRAYGKPAGLSAPRPGGRDDLKRINGIGPRIERRLNQLGIFHFDQIAAWDKRTVVWVENQFSLRGIIQRERWVQQARELVTTGGASLRR